MEYNTNLIAFYIFKYLDIPISQGQYDLFSETEKEYIENSRSPILIFALFSASNGMRLTNQQKQLLKPDQRDLIEKVYLAAPGVKEKIKKVVDTKVKMGIMPSEVELSVLSPKELKKRLKQFRKNFNKKMIECFDNVQDFCNHALKRCLNRYEYQMLTVHGDVFKFFFICVVIVLLLNWIAAVYYIIRSIPKELIECRNQLKIIRQECKQKALNALKSMNDVKKEEFLRYYE